MAKPKSGKNESARLHYIYCDGCGEYSSHTIRTKNVCAGNCGLYAHDDPRCPLVGRVIGHTHEGNCYDC